jgi:anti-sigma factor RsiW
MSSVADPQPDPAAEEIVAYLDGELPPQDCRRVENRLATDEGYRQDLHELDRAWEALDVLPAPTVDDGFAQTTIELACVAAEADLSEHSAAAKATNRHRIWQWLAAGVAASVLGLLAGHALIPNRNAELLADLPAIHQLNVLPYVDNVEFLRRLSTAMPPEKFVKDEQTFDRNVKELENANSPSFETRREWIQSLPAERKAELADHTRTFNDSELASEEREHMRQVMEDVREATDKDNLQKTLVAYGQWLSRHSGGQQERLHEQLRGLPVDEQLALVQKTIEADEEQRFRHLSLDEAEQLRQEIKQMAKEKRRAFMAEHKGNREPKLDEQRTRQAIRELFQDNAKRAEIEERLTRKLSPESQAHLKALEKSQRPFDKGRQMGMWIREAMSPKVDQEELEDFFASEDKLTPDQRQELLDMPRAKMEAELKNLYFNWKLGIKNPGPIFGDAGESGRMPWTGPGAGPPREGGPNRPPVFGSGRDPRPDGPAGEPRQRKRPPRPVGNPPPPEQKPEAI